ncbi:hypothetical protein PV325_012623 [Microctonus aethiopoides]|nr:hypothetical protein PV325_012623 [Microctonus aethiopoides]
MNVWIGADADIAGHQRGMVMKRTSSTRMAADNNEDLNHDGREKLSISMTIVSIHLTAAWDLDPVTAAWDFFFRTTWDLDAVTAAWDNKDTNHIEDL